MRVADTQVQGSLDIERFETPGGPLLALWAGPYLVFSSMGPGGEAAAEKWVRSRRFGIGGERATGLAGQVERFFKGIPDAFDGLAGTFVGGTPFQRRVWQTLLRIPFGEVWTYGMLAHAVGLVTGARPVGQAVGANPLTLFVPCHRVVGVGGGLTGFGCGLPVKRKLLKAEGWRIEGRRLATRLCAPVEAALG